MYVPDLGEITWPIAFVTGSRAYGAPRDDSEGSASDVDLVVYVTEETMDQLTDLADHVDDMGELAPASQPEASEDGSSKLEFGRSLRFGRLNLICCTTQRRYEAWRVGTEQLIAQARRTGKPVTRDAAIAVFRPLRAAAAKQEARQNGD